MDKVAGHIDQKGGADPQQNYAPLSATGETSTTRKEKILRRGTGSQNEEKDRAGTRRKTVGERVLETVE